MNILTAKEMVADLVCSACRAPALACGDGPDVTEVICGACGRHFPCQNQLIDFLLREELDQTNLNELAGNEWDTSDPKVIQSITNKDRWSPVYVHSLRYGLDVVNQFIQGSSAGATLVSLGSGAAFELKIICSRNRFRRVYSSDISRSATSMAPTTLAHLDGQLGLFVAEFGHVPISKRENVIGLVFQALHHTTEIHAATDRLLKQSFERLVVVEPTTNWVVEILARFGLAKRVEYSGLDPSWMNLRRMRAVADRNGCRMKVKTWWEVPPGFARFFVSYPRMGRIVSRMVDGISRVTNWVSLGSMSCVLFIREKAMTEPTAPHGGSAATAE